MTSELETALSAARRAGEVLRAGFGAEHAITYKGEVDFVTEVDGRKEAQMASVECVRPAFALLSPL